MKDFKEFNERAEQDIRVALDQAKEQPGHMLRFDVSEISSYETAKKLLIVDVVGTKTNAEMLAKVPHTDMEDLSMVYRMQLEQLPDGAVTLLVTNNLMESMGVTKEQLHADALVSSERLRPASIRTMAEALSEMMGIPAEDFPTEASWPQLYVVSNELNSHGAAAAFYSDFMEQAAKEIGSSFFMLPSSVHEVLFVPDDGSLHVDDLRAMVILVNETEVAPEERLTDSVYHYDAAEKVFELGESWEARALIQ